MAEVIEVHIFNRVIKVADLDDQHTIVIEQLLNILYCFVWIVEIIKHGR